MYNLAKLQKALDGLETKARFVNMDYYYPRFQKLLGFCNKNNLDVRV